jgi:hypothetical protein
MKEKNIAITVRPSYEALAKKRFLKHNGTARGRTKLDRPTKYTTLARPINAR